MTKEIESISSALFDKIRSRFTNVTLGNEKAKAESDPGKARFFNFTYAGEDGAEFGTVTISLIDETSLKVYFGQNISGEMDREQRKTWYEFLRNLRQFARRNLLTFDTRDINKSNLDLKDVKQQAKADDKFTVDDVPVVESKLYGTPGRPYNSFADKGNTKILIRHQERVNDEVRGSRARKIEEIFLETERGERLLLNHTNLHGAYAMAEHLNHGGDMRDEIAGHINEIVAEMAAMRHFVRSTKHRQFEDHETADMTRAAVHHYDELKRTLRRMRGARGYRSYFESWLPESGAVEDEVDEAALRERFVKKIYDDRFNEALPIVYKAYKKYKTEAAGQMGTELEEWAESVTEGFWDDAPVETNFDFDALQDKMNAPWTTGVDGIDATTELKQIFPGRDLDNLNSSIGHYAIDQGPDADVRPLVKIWLQNHLPDTLAQLSVGQQDGDNDKTNHINPVSPKQAHPNDTYGNTGMDDPVTDPNIPSNMQENKDSLLFLRQLAGLVK